MTTSATAAAAACAAGVRAIHHGADDNASGTTALIELARRFGAEKDRQGRRLVFIAFSGEEMGLLGSKYYVEHPLFPLESTVAMVNMDMVGRLSMDPKTEKGKLEVGGTGTAKEFDALIDKLNAKYGFEVKKNKSGVGPSDHTSFYLKGVPVFFLFTGLHKQYHKPTDMVDLINFAGMSRITDMAEELVRQLASESPRPEYVKGMGSQFTGGRMSVPRLGFMPGNYDDDADGVLIGSVTKGGPAEKGGVKDGDRIVAVAGEPIKNMTMYMTVMGKQKRNQPVEITVDPQGRESEVDSDAAVMVMTCHSNAKAGTRKPPCGCSEQPRPGCRRTAAGFDCLRRLRQGGPQLETVTGPSKPRCNDSKTTKRCSCRAASRSA